jgi:hypothetical protein
VSQTKALGLTEAAGRTMPRYILGSNVVWQLIGAHRIQLKSTDIKGVREYAEVSAEHFFLDQMSMFERD